MKKMSVYTEAFFVHSVLRRPRMDLVTYGGQQLLKTDARSGLQQKRVASVSSTLSPKPFNGGPLCLLTKRFAESHCGKYYVAAPCDIM